MNLGPDPRSDDRTPDLLDADPEEVASLSQRFRGICDTVDSARNGLRGAEGDGEWHGGAADAFRRNLGKLPGELDRVFDSYERVSWALWNYEGQLRDAQSRFDRTLGELDQAYSRLRTLERTQADAAPAERQTWEAPIYRAAEDIIALHRQGFSVLDQFDAERQQLRANIESAGQVAFGSAWERYVVDDAGHFMAGVGGFVVHFGEHTLKALEDLPGDLAAVVGSLERGDWGGALHNLRKLASDASTVLGVAALILAVAAMIVAPELIPAFVGAAELLGSAASVASGTAAATDLASGDGKDFVFDALGAIPVGKVLGIGGPGIKAAEDDQVAARAAFESAENESHGLEMAGQELVFMQAAGDRQLEELHALGLLTGPEASTLRALQSTTISQAADALENEQLYAELDVLRARAGLDQAKIALAAAKLPGELVNDSWGVGVDAGHDAIERSGTDRAAGAQE